MREAVHRAETPRERTQRGALAEDLSSSPLRGRPLPLRLRNFRPAADAYLASAGGPLPYMVRLRELHELTLRHERALADAWVEVARAAGGDGPAFARAWLEIAERWSFVEANELIDRHNRWYPAEARLPMDPRTGDFVRVNGDNYRRAPLDSRWILERFPPSIDAALGR